VQDEMQPIVTDVPWFACLLDPAVSPTKKDEPIKVAFRGMDLGGPQEPY